MFIPPIYQNQLFQSMSKNDLYDSFRSITLDQQISDNEIDKFMKWGNNNLQKALNYYFNKKDKPINNKQTTLGVFGEMQKNAKKQQNTLQYIQNLKRQYELPIVGNRKSQQSQPNSKHNIDQQQSQNQFSDADYLPDAFNRNKLQPALQKKAYQQQQQYFIEKSELKKINYSDVGTKEQTKKPKSVNAQKMLDPQPKKTKKLYQKFIDKELYVGQVVVNCVATETRSMADCPIGSAIEFQHYFQLVPNKKKSFKKKQAPNLNIRCSFKGRLFGRIQDLQARIFAPLIEKSLIRIQGEMLYTPAYISFPNKLQLLIKVYLQNKAITEPIVQTFMGKTDNLLAMYKEVRQQLLALFQKLNLKTLTQPLIKTKSQLNKNQNSNTYSQKSSQTTTQYERLQKIVRQKQQQEIRRRKTDPNYNQIQKTLKTGFFVKKSQQLEAQCDNKNQQNQKIQNGQSIHKRTIQMKSDQDAKYTQLIDIYHEDLKIIDTPENFISKLYNYQSLALAWMLKRQCYQQEEGKTQQQQIHPLWTQYQIENSKYHLYFNELTAQISINRPLSKKRCKGGILADEMGLGKTVMMSALITANNIKIANNKQGKNLIILPLTLLSQWESQLKKHTRGLKIIQYYSIQRAKHAKQLHQYDVVLTTYGTVAHQFAKANHVTKTGLYKYHWKRIILDEAHYIKGRIIQTAKAVYQLQGQYRWCLTGTPIQNGLTDLFSLIHFIRYTPWSQYQCWSRYIEKPFQNKEEGIIDILRTLLKRVFLRRTKGSRDQNGNLIVELPPRTSNVQILQMNEKQRKFYSSVYDASRKKIDDLMQQGVLQAKYMQVLEILMRLRQICCHPALFKSLTKFVKDPHSFAAQFRKFLSKRQKQKEKQLEAEVSEQGYDEPIIEQNQEQVKIVHVSGEQEKVSQAYFKQTMNKIVNNQLQACRICLNDIQNPVITVCLHIFCKPCIIRQIQQNQSCGFCRKKISKEDIMHLPRENRLDFNTDQQMYRSTKMRALMQHLKKLKQEDKAVVFSQFLGMLDLIEADLNHNKIMYVRMQGSDTHKQRSKAIKSFETNPKIQVFLVSLRTAGVGLNLVAANKVFLVDPWWNPGVQQQAIERVHRIGQKRQVNIIRFIMDESIEMRMLQLNMNKKALSQIVMANQVNTESKAAVLKYLMQKY